MAMYRGKHRCLLHGPILPLRPAMKVSLIGTYCHQDHLPRPHLHLKFHTNFLTLELEFGLHQGVHDHRGYQRISPWRWPFCHVWIGSFGTRVLAKQQSLGSTSSNTLIASKTVEVIGTIYIEHGTVNNRLG